MMDPMSDHDDTYDERPAPRPRRRVSYDPARGHGEEAFRAARRHSRLVRRLRFVLPALAIVGVAAFVGTARFYSAVLPDFISVAGIDTDSESIVIDKPHISGFAGTRRAYEVTAESAEQSLRDPKVVTFNGIDARFGLDDAGTAAIEAGTGVFDGNANTLTMAEGIAITTTSGYWASFEEAAIDIRNGTLVSTEPIEIRTNEGVIRANGIEVTDRGKRIAFVNGVSVTYAPPGELAATPAADAPRADP